MLESVAETVWIAEGSDVSFHGFAYPTRMAIVRLAGGNLWIWSPIKLCRELAEEVEHLGPVSHIVSPNKLHHLFLKEWCDRFPSAHLWGPASLIAKRRDLAFTAALDDVAPSAWAAEIDQAWFRGSPFLDEFAFFHRATRTAIIADIIQAFSADYLMSHWKAWQRLLIGGSRASITLKGGGGTPLDWRLSFLRRHSAKVARSKVVGWDAERVIIAHGVWQPQEGKAFIEHALSWLARE